MCFGVLPHLSRPFQIPFGRILRQLARRYLVFLFVRLGYVFFSYKFSTNFSVLWSMGISWKLLRDWFRQCLADGFKNKASSFSFLPCCSASTSDVRWDKRVESPSSCFSFLCRWCYSWTTENLSPSCECLLHLLQIDDFLRINHLLPSWICVSIRTCTFFFFYYDTGVRNFRLKMGHISRPWKLSDEMEQYKESPPRTQSVRALFLNGKPSGRTRNNPFPIPTDVGGERD